MYTDHQSTDDQSVPPVSVYQCQLSVLISATCQCKSVPHQCHISVSTSAYQCHISVPILAALQCHPSVPVSATYQCQSVPVSAYKREGPPINVNQCCQSVSHLSVSVSATHQCPPISAHQCRLSVHR
ncbi:unnamed protein product, partial [Staurois parvus]